MKDLLRSILALFDEQIAKLFDKLRISSPLVYAIVLAVILGVGEFLRQYVGGLESVPEWVQYVIIFMEALSSILLSSRTKRHMPEEMDKVSEVQLKVLSADEIQALKDYDD